MALAALSCGSSEETTPDSGGPSAARVAKGADSGADQVASLPESPLLRRPTEVWLGDLPQMRERHFIRVLVTHNRTNFFSEMGRPRGFEYDLLKEFEKSLNTGRPRGEVETTLAFVPTSLDGALDALVEGRGDLVAAGLTVTAERAERVAFTEPYIRGVDEIVVTRRGLEGLGSLGDLCGRSVVVRKGSSYASHLRALTGECRRQGREPLEVVEEERGLETEDLLELVDAGALDLTVADRHVAELWQGALPEILLREDLVVHAGGEIAWAVRPESVELRRELSEFARKNRKGSLLGNILFRRYFQGSERIRNPLTPEEQAKVDRYSALFQKHAETYGFDWLAVAAQAYQESGFDQSRRSTAGAVGIMQIKPSTAADKNVGIADIGHPENNIHAGIKYLAFLRDRYFDDEAIPEAVRFDFALAAYNAGPARVRQLRQKAAEAGLDPNRWFGNVEVVALETVGREPVRYVADVNKYYLAYKLMWESRQRRAGAAGGPG